MWRGGCGDCWWSRRGYCCCGVSPSVRGRLYMRWYGLKESVLTGCDCHVFRALCVVGADAGVSRSLSGWSFFPLPPAGCGGRGGGRATVSSDGVERNPAAQVPTPRQHCQPQGDCHWYVRLTSVSVCCFCFLLVFESLDMAATATDEGMCARAVALVVFLSCFACRIAALHFLFCAQMERKKTRPTAETAAFIWCSSIWITT